MIPRRVELTNFLSFGDPPQIIEFTDDEPLWVLCGANGVGKSAVFDAITFALFGQHRGGAQNADQLIRHGANTFLVVFEFEFSNTRYELHRGRARRAPVQRVRRQNGAEWEDIDLTRFSGRDKIREWAEATLGLDYTAFTASVMLRQGEADKIITAAPRDRLDFLRQIIGAERYERLHDRIRAVEGSLRARLAALNAERDRVPEVTAAQLEEASSALQLATVHLESARASRDAAAVRVEQAGRWNGLVQQRANVERQLREADARAGERERIRNDHARFEILGQVLPVARELVGLRDGLKRLDAEIARIAGELNDVTVARDSATTEVAAARQRATEHGRQVDDNRRDAERLRDQIARTQRLAVLADEVAQLEEQSRRFPAELDARHTTASEDVNRFAEQRRTAGERRAAASGLLQAAESRRRDFDSVEVGTECSRCGQPVSEEHARREKADLDADISRHLAERDAAQTEERTASRALGEATAERDRLTDEVRERDRVRDRFELQRRNLTAQGATGDAAALRAGIADHAREAARLEEAAHTAARERQEAEAAATRHDGDRQRHERRATALTGELATANTNCTRDSARRDSLLDRLPHDWRERFPTLTLGNLTHDQADLDRLRNAEIAARFRQLQQDDTLRAEWEQRRTQLNHDIVQIPPDAHCPVADAEHAARDARDQLTQAEAAHAAARDLDTQHRCNADRRRELTRQRDELSRNHRLHETLAGHLGPNGLQRDLVRRAEEAIVRFANNTVRNLSRGDLTIELDTAEDGPDRAFALRVRRADDPIPIGVQFLSGSQKFRVAVAIALAIGRFASGQARPLESVIIDEGFGSLDRDGLQAMSEELRNLQQSQDLRRLILVSHQEEFTAGFPVGYRLHRGDNGTTAERFRREGGAPG